MRAPVTLPTPRATPGFTKLKAPQSERHEAPFIFTINKIDSMIDRYRCQSLTEEQAPEQSNLYTQAKELTDMDIQAHAAKLYDRSNTYCSFRHWSHLYGQPEFP